MAARALGQVRDFGLATVWFVWANYIGLVTPMTHNGIYTRLGQVRDFGLATVCFVWVNYTDLVTLMTHNARALGQVQSGSSLGELCTGCCAEPHCASSTTHVRLLTSYGA